MFGLGFAYLVSAKKGIEYQASVGELVARQWARLLDGTSIRGAGFTHVGIVRVVVRSIGSTECIFSEEGAGRMRKVMIH